MVSEVAQLPEAQVLPVTGKGDRVRGGADGEPSSHSLSFEHCYETY